ncbi:MAG: ribonuclease R [Proteobacteria bacterium]|nr:ribonuclease R [Pseudomonadota bacterium]
MGSYGPGHIVEFIDKNQFICAFCVGLKKDRLRVVTETNREVTLAPGRVVCGSPSGWSAEAPRERILAKLKEAAENRAAWSEQVDVELLWDLVSDEDERLTPSELAELFWPKAPSADQVSAVARALFEDRLRFRFTGQEFIPLSRDQVEQKTLQRRCELAYEAEVSGAAEWLAAAWEGRPVAEPEDRDQILRLIMDWVLYGDEAPQKKRAQDVLDRAGLAKPDRSFEVLVRLGVWDEDEDLERLRCQISDEFSPAILDEAASVSTAATDWTGREDLRNLDVVTIDGALTTDYDDALSIEVLDSGWRLGVHIADVAAMIEPGSVLDIEASRRGTSLYLPEARIPMLPETLSEGRLSLLEGQERPAVSVFGELDRAGRVRHFEVKLSRVRVGRRLTYDTADQDLATDPDLQAMYEAARAFRDWRGAQGAFFLPLPEVQVQVDRDKNIEVKKYARETPARQLVAEAMILANYLVACWLEDNDVPCIYRTQSMPGSEIVTGDEEDLFLHFSQRRLLQRVELLTSPAPHSSLGVPNYTHFTSPIRRYFDLIVQRQLTGSLGGRGPVYSTEELAENVVYVEPLVRQAARVTQLRHRYWILKLLGQKKGQTTPALVLDVGPRRVSVLLTDYMLLTGLRRHDADKLQPGQEVPLKIKKVNPREDLLQLEPVH